MFGMLIQIFRRDPIAGGLSLARQRDIAFEHLIGIAADLHARPVAVECLDAVRHAAARAIVVRRAAAASITAA